jgi:hypothetical protein
MHAHNSLRLLKHRATFPTSCAITFPFLLRETLRLEKWEVSRCLAVAHSQETENHEDPVYVIRNDGPVRGGVLPPEDGIEDTPAAATVEFWVTELRGC